MEADVDYLSPLPSLKKKVTFKPNDFIEDIIANAENLKDNRTIYNEILDDVYLNEIKENLDDEKLVDTMQT